ncbi:MAG: hypothetical protein AB9907_08905 [Flexilinea sp.]
MLGKILNPFLIIGFILSVCTQTPAAKDQKDIQLIQQTGSIIPSQTLIPTERFETSDTTPVLIDDPLSSLKWKMVKNEEGYLLLIGFVNAPHAEVYYQFPESYQFPHEHAKDDFRILDGNGSALEFEEVDPGELNLYMENPLGEGIFDPRAFRILQEEVQSPLILEIVNLIQGVNLPDQSDLSFTIQFDASFPLEKNKWDIDQTIDLIPDHPFTMKYFDATVFNDYNQGEYNGPQNTFFYGTYYLEGVGFEGITINQIVPAERRAEWPDGWGGSEQACTEIFMNCIMSDAGLLNTKDNIYKLQITAYRLIIRGPWQVQFDLP